MAKRFTDTGKWDKAWFRRLSPSSKCAWVFLCDRCDHAGVWELDLDALNFFIGAQFSAEDLAKIFGDRIQIVGTKLVVTGFVEFQYGDLNPENRVHKSVISRLEKLAPNKPLKRPFQGSKDKDKDKDKDKVLGELERIYAAYPRKIGKAAGLRKLKDVDAAEVWQALNHFLAHLKREKTEKQYIPHFSTWANNWRDWLDPAAGQSESFAESQALDFKKITGAS